MRVVTRTTLALSVLVLGLAACEYGEMGAAGEVTREGLVHSRAEPVTLPNGKVGWSIECFNKQTNCLNRAAALCNGKYRVEGGDNRVTPTSVLVNPQMGLVTPIGGAQVYTIYASCY